MTARWAFGAFVALALAAAVACGEALSAPDDELPDRDAGETDAKPDLPDTSPQDAGCRIVWDAAPRVFADISPSAEGGTEIVALGEAGIAEPCSGNAFCPNQTVRRREALRWAVRAYVESTGDSAYACDVYFTDVLPDDPDFGYVHKAREIGMTGGCGPNIVCPDVDVAREGVVVFATRLAAQGSSDASVSRFADVPPNDSALGLIERAAELGLVSPCAKSEADASADAGPDASYFCPAAPATRRFAAVAIERARELR